MTKNNDKLEITFPNVSTLDIEEILLTLEELAFDCLYPRDEKMLSQFEQLTRNFKNLSAGNKQYAKKFTMGKKLEVKLNGSGNSETGNNLSISIDKRYFSFLCGVMTSAVKKLNIDRDIQLLEFDDNHTDIVIDDKSWYIIRRKKADGSVNYALCKGKVGRVAVVNGNLSVHAENKEEVVFRNTDEVITCDPDYNDDNFIEKFRNWLRFENFVIV